MKIRTQLRLAMLLSVTLAVYVGLILMWVTYRIDEQVHQTAAISHTLEHLGKLEQLSFEYGQQGLERARRQWEIQYRYTAEALDSMIAIDHSAGEQYGSLMEDFRRLKGTYEKLVLINQRVAVASPDQQLVHVEMRNRMSVQLMSSVNDKLVKTRSLLGLAQLSTHSTIHQAIVSVASSMILLVLLIGLIAYVTGKKINSSLAKLRDGARVVGAGNLDYEIAPVSQDEIGEVTQEFNQMAQHLKEANCIKQEALDISIKSQMELGIRANELEQIAYTVSHDLKSPLISIRGFVGLLRKDIERQDFSEINENINVIDTAAASMSENLKGLLDLIRVGRLVGEKQDVSLAILAKESINLTAGPINEQKTAIDISPRLPVVYCDPKRIVQVFQNLLENACKFMGEQTQPRIKVGVRNVDGENIYFVKDNGIGIDPQYHKKIFGLFNRISDTTKGSGIGLTLVKKIIDVHGGRVWVESVGKQKGSTFNFTLSEREQTTNCTINKSYTPDAVHRNSS